jgi:PEGA domain
MKSPLRWIVSLCCFVLLFLASSVFAKDAPGIVLYWPNQSQASIKVTFGVFHQVTSYAGKLTLVTDVIIENVSGKPIPQASFTVYLLDKDKVRIGSGVLVFDDLTPGEATKVQFQCETVGVPSTLALSAHKGAEGVPNATKVVPLKIISVPAGAKLKVDGQDEGITPALVNLSVGQHTVELSKDGFAPATSPVDIKADEMAGGSITIELGGMSQDAIELRDGTVLTGDAISLSLTELVFRVDGKDTKYGRNQIKKISLVERMISNQPAVVQPVQLKEKK